MHVQDRDERDVHRCNRQSTGSFKGATGHGDFTVTLSGTGPIQGKATTCSMGNNGPNVSAIKSVSIVFNASGPLTVKQ